MINARDVKEMFISLEYEYNKEGMIENIEINQNHDIINDALLPKLILNQRISIKIERTSLKYCLNGLPFKGRTDMLVGLRVRDSFNLFSLITMYEHKIGHMYDNDSCIEIPPLQDFVFVQFVEPEAFILRMCATLTGKVRLPVY